jgi:hypothetical protein
MRRLPLHRAAQWRDMIMAGARARARTGAIAVVMMVVIVSLMHLRLP